MREVITISLNGNAYQIEQGGYEVLRAYLETAQTKLGEDPDRAEILADLEQAIADKCERHLGPHKTVVTLAEMQQILTEMGPVVAEPAAAGAPGAAADPGAPPGGPSPEPPPAPKRLYQIREGAILSGVCMGLAAYFNVDVTLVRLLFVVLAIVTGGLWVLAYIAMMIVIPYASTSEERAAAYGQPFSALHLVDAVRRQMADAGTRQWQRQMRRNARSWQRAFRREQRHMRAAYRHGWAPPAFDPEAGFGVPLLLGVLMPVAALLQVALVLTFVIALLQLITTGAIFGWQPPQDIPLWADILVMAILLNLFTEPLRALRRGYYYGPAANAWIALWGGLMWIGVTVACAWLAYQHWPQLQALIEQLDEALRHHNTHITAGLLTGGRLGG